MPRYKSERDFQLGEYWLSKQARSEAWCRTWFDQTTRQTKRISLRTTDFDEAKQRLTDWFVLNHTKQEEKVEDVLLAEVFARFYEQHGSTLKSAIDVKRALRYWVDFHGEATIAEATQQSAQAEFRQWLTDTKSVGASSIKNCLAIGKSALNWAWKRGEIGPVPYIALGKPPKPEPKGRPLEVAEVAKLFAAANQHHVSVLMAFMLGTAARTGAIMSLTLDQIDEGRELIHLNPQGRQQTKKYRPTVKLPNQLLDYVKYRLERPFSPQLVAYKGAAVASIKKAWGKTRTDSQLTGNVQTYSFRHTMARWMRMQSVPAWEVAAQLGHKSSEHSTTEIYAPFDPAYLSKATEAINDFLYQVACELRVSSMSEFLINQAQAVDFDGTPNRIRTCDLLIKSQLLYQLSYGRIRTRHIV